MGAAGSAYCPRYGAGWQASIGLAAARPAVVKLVDDAVVAAVLAEQLAGRVPVRFVGHVHPR
jgi:hypothetical protein